MQPRVESALVIGLGRSGQEVALLLHERGVRVSVVDDATGAILEKRAGRLQRRGIPVRLGAGQEIALEREDVLVVSPGVRPEHPLVQIAQARKIPVCSELELASSLLPNTTTCAITGTNGKTTTTRLAGAMLLAKDPRTKIGGNIGVPLARLVRKSSHNELAGPVVLEVSSFQLHFTDTFSPDVYAVLNVGVDHLDWHPSLAAYARAKASPLERMSRQDTAVLNYDDPHVRSMGEHTQARVVYFSETTKLQSGVYKCNNRVVASLDKRKQLDLDGLPIRRFHSWQNVLCAIGVALVFDVPLEAVEAVLRAYQPLEHRQQQIATVHGVNFIDDSKATNVSAVKQFLFTMKSPGVLIMGGKDKGGSFAELASACEKRIHHIMVIGEASERITEELGRATCIIACDSLEAAVRHAFALAQPGEVVALCPGCSSFDQFANYRHRGQVFREAVRRLCRSADEKSRTI